MNASPASSPWHDSSTTERIGERALVLAGAGSTGNAWEIGVVAGLSEAGLDVTDADLIVGTSAGSTVAAQITGASPADLLAAILDAPPRPQAGPGGPGRGGNPNGPARAVMARTAAIIEAAEDPADMRRRMGAAALEDSDPASHDDVQAQRRAVVATRLPSQDWPEQMVWMVVVDAHTGEPAVLDRRSGVDLADAVAASTSNGFPYTIGGKQYINGGYRRNENADLAAGYARVLVLSPFAGRSRHPVEWGTDLAAQVAELRDRGSRVETVFPDGDSEHLFGANAMDLSLRPAAARAGYDRGRALAERLTDFWRRTD